MQKSSFLIGMETHQLNPEDLAEVVIANPTLLPDVFDSLSAQGYQTSNACIFTLLKISRVSPQILYPYFHWFVDMLGSERLLMRRLASFALHQIVRVDCQNKFADFPDLLPA